MSIVLVIGQKKLSCVEIKVKGKEIIVGETFFHTIDNLSELLCSVEGVKKLLSSVFGNNLKDAVQHKLYYAFSSGSGLAYKTWQAAPSSFTDVADKSYAEKEERILTLCRDNIPEGFLDLYKDATCNVVSCYEDDDLYTVTSAYAPSLYIQNLVEGSEAVGFSVFGIGDIASSFYKLIDTGSRQYLVQADGLTVALNSFGALCLMLPSGYGDSIADIIYGMVEKYYPMKKEARSASRILQSSELESALKVHIYGLTKKNCEAAVIAVGCILDDKVLVASSKAKKPAENTESISTAGSLDKKELDTVSAADIHNEVHDHKKGDAKESVIGKLRKLFKKK